MLIELLLVGAILMYLNARGIIDFNSPNAMAASISIILVCLFVVWAGWYLVARMMVDGLFGFSSWSPRKPLKSSISPAGSEVAPERFEALKKMVEEAPKDAELSRQYSQQLLLRGMVEEFVAERLRILQVGHLNMSEKCAIYNRLADVELERGNAEQALQYLNEIAKGYPDSNEAANARKRMIAMENLLTRADGDSAA